MCVCVWCDNRNSNSLFFSTQGCNQLSKIYYEWFIYSPLICHISFFIYVGFVSWALYSIGSLFIPALILNIYISVALQEVLIFQYRPPPAICFIRNTVALFFCAILVQTCQVSEKILLGLQLHLQSNSRLVCGNNIFIIFLFIKIAYPSIQFLEVSF